MPPIETLTPPTPTPPTFIEKMERHPYLALAVVALIVGAIGLVIVLEHAGVSAEDGGIAWNGAGSIFTGGNRALTPEERLKAQEIVKQQSPDTQLGYIPLPVDINATGDSQSGADDFAKLLAQLTQPKTQAGTSAETTPSAYAYIPSGLITVDSTTRSRSSGDDELYTYGNAVGNYIQSFESMNSNAAQILKDQAEERTNADKTDAVRRMGVAYAELGRDLNIIDPIPASAKSLHSAYATSYRIIGTNLTKIATAANDKDYIDAITTYNDSVDGLTKRFLALVTFFAAHNITFSSSDPGSIFMFNSSSGTSL